MNKKLPRRTPKAWRVAETTPEIVAEIAQRLGYTYARAGSIGALLDAIATGEVALVRKGEWRLYKSKAAKEDDRGL